MKLLSQTWLSRRLYENPHGIREGRRNNAGILRQEHDCRCKVQDTNTYIYIYIYVCMYIYIYDMYVYIYIYMLHEYYIYILHKYHVHICIDIHMCMSYRNMKILSSYMTRVQVPYMARPNSTTCGPRMGLFINGKTHILMVTIAPIRMVMTWGWFIIIIVVLPTLPIF